VSFSLGGGLKGEAIEKQFDFHTLKQLLVCPTFLIKSVLCIFKSAMQLQYFLILLHILLQAGKIIIYLFG